MNSSALALSVAIKVLSILAVICLFALFDQRLREILGTLFGLILRPLLLINNSLQTFWGGVKEFYRGQFSVDGQIDLQTVFFQFIGAVLYTIFFLSFNFAEFHLLALSVTAAGIDAGQFNTPIGAGTLTAFALIASFLFWGAIVLDLSGITKTAPWRETLNEKWQKYLLYITIFCLSLSLIVSSSMGLFRGKVIADESLNSNVQSVSNNGGISDSTTGYISSDPLFSEQMINDSSRGMFYWIPIIANVCIPVLVGIGGVFASWGVVTLIKFIILAAGFLVIAPLGLFLLISSLLVNIIDRLYQFIDAILQLIAAMGNRFFGIFGWNPAGPSKKDTLRNDSDSRKDDDEDDEDDNDPHDQSSPEQGWDPYRRYGE